MTSHPGDTPAKRFGALLLGLGGIALFGVLGLLVWFFTDANAVSEAAKERVEGRLAIKKEVDEAQAGGAKKINDEAVSASLAKLKGRTTPTKTEKPVPGTKAFEDWNRAQMEAQKKEAAAKKAKDAAAEKTPAPEAKTETETAPE